MADLELPSSEALRRNALSRSAQRSARVARRRLLWRWVGWTANQVLRWLLLPALLIAAAVSTFHDDTPPAGLLGQPLTPAPPPALPSPHGPGLQLRLDEEQTPYAPHAPPARRPPQAQSGATPAASRQEFP